MNNRSVVSFRGWLLALTFLVLAGAIAAPIIGSAIINAKEAETQLTITCASARSNIVQLEALADISRTLGIPFHPAIPTLPPECQP